MDTDAGRWVEVGDGVLARRYTELDLTVGLVLGGERALVVDTRGDERQGAEWAAAVRAVTALPIEVVLTHAHFDHCFGTAAFLPCPVHAHPACRAAITATAAAQRAEWAACYHEHGDPATADALTATRPVLPDHRVDPAVTLDLGGRSADLRYLGRGHTDHDLVVHVPDSAVVLAGDLLEQGAPPDFGDAFPADWPHTVTALLALGPRTVVPGHGDPMDPGEVAEQRDALAEVAALHAAVGAREIDAGTAERRSPYPGVPWSGVPRTATHPPEKGDSRAG
ncbi:MBL fold metallo-hydrolase [Pseudonocardia acidicola]|uniref:MBL fold metallo-hydrolase n=1 Tax=Pseudonocardia acidicola TaxID=2724939 RepID=UPI0030842E53